MDAFNSMIGGLTTDTLRSAQTAAAQQAGRQKINSDDVENTAKDFESVFLAEMLQPMFATVETNSMFGGGEGEDMYKSMLVQEYAKNLANAGGIGLASSLKEQFIAMQEKGQM